MNTMRKFGVAVLLVVLVLVGVIGVAFADANTFNWTPMQESGSPIWFTDGPGWVLALQNGWWPSDNCYARMGIAYGYGDTNIIYSWTKTVPNGTIAPEVYCTDCEPWPELWCVDGTLYASSGLERRRLVTPQQFLPIVVGEPGGGGPALAEPASQPDPYP